MNVLSFSGGRTSAYMLAKYREEIDLVIFANTGKEALGTLDFVRKCGEYFEKDIVWLEYTTDNKQKFNVVNFDTANRNGKPFKQLIEKRKFIPNVGMRFCSMEMKALTIKRYLKSIDINIKEVDMYLGIRADEPSRYHRLKDNMRNGWYNKMPLYKDRIIEEDVLNYWSSQPFNLDINKWEGNCDLCFLKGMSKKLELLRQKPEVAKWWIEMEGMIGATFHKKYSVREILHMSQSQLNLFEGFDDDIECACNID